MRIDGILLPKGIKAKNFAATYDSVHRATPSFKDTLSSFLMDVNTTQKASGEAKLQLLSGRSSDVHQVMNKSAEADVAFNMLMEIRNKALDGYNEIVRLRI